MAELQKLILPEPFTIESGFTFPSIEVGYCTWGNLNSTKSNVIIICHALTGNPFADEWFAGLFGEGKLLDPEKYFIICTNVLPGAYGTTGPRSINPETGKQYAGDFPIVSLRDMVNLQREFINQLGIDEIRLVIGGSMGGMQALEWGIMDKRVQKMILISHGKAHSAWAIAFNHTQRRAIMADPLWKDGHYSESNPPSNGLETARMIAMISYRTFTSFESRFSRDRQPNNPNLWKTESYLNYQGQKLSGRFDPLTYVRITQAMDLFDISQGRKGFSEVLGAINIPTLVVGFDSDILYPVSEQKELAQLIPGARYVEFSSTNGHDGFLTEVNEMEPVFRQFQNSKTLLA